MMYVLASAVVLLLVTVAIMVKLWRGYYGETYDPLMSEQEIQKLEERFAEIGAPEPIRVRQLFEGEVLWSEGMQDTWRWSWEAGKRGKHAYSRFLVTFLGGLGQGIVLERGGRQRVIDESSVKGALGPKVVVVSEEVLPAYFLCKARDEARLLEFLTEQRRMHLCALDARVSTLYFDDRFLFVQCHELSGFAELWTLLNLTQDLVKDVVTWSAAQGVLAALETGQYQGALAELEQATLRDLSSLEESEPLGINEPLPQAPT